MNGKEVRVRCLSCGKFNKVNSITNRCSNCGYGGMIVSGCPTCYMMYLKTYYSFQIQIDIKDKRIEELESKLACLNISNTAFRTDLKQRDAWLSDLRKNYNILFSQEASLSAQSKKRLQLIKDLEAELEHMTALNKQLTEESSTEYFNLIHKGAQDAIEHFSKPEYKLSKTDTLNNECPRCHRHGMDYDARASDKHRDIFVCTYKNCQYVIKVSIKDEGGKEFWQKLMIKIEKNKALEEEIGKQGETIGHYIAKLALADAKNQRLTERLGEGKKPL